MKWLNPFYLLDLLDHKERNPDWRKLRSVLYLALFALLCFTGRMPSFTHWLIFSLGFLTQHGLDVLAANWRGQSLQEDKTLRSPAANLFEDK